MDDGFRIRDIDPASDAEVDLVARRMRQTLVEVEGEEAGMALYTMQWLRDRVRWHLDPASTTGRVFLAEGPGGQVLGHAIVRIEADDSGRRFGLCGKHGFAITARHVHEVTGTVMVRLSKPLEEAASRASGHPA